MLRGVRALLHDEGYTIKGVQRLHKEQGMKRLLQAAPGNARSALADAGDRTAPLRMFTSGGLPELSEIRSRGGWKRCSATCGAPRPGCGV